MGFRARTLVETACAHPAISAFVVAGAALAYFCAGIAARELTLLESQDLSVAADLFRTYRLSADHSPLHFVLLNLWQRVGGVSVALVRLPSAVCCAAAVALVFRLVERAGGLGAALAAALVFASNPELVEHARSLRLYGFGILAYALCLERADAFVRGSEEAALFGFLVGAVVAVHTHLFLWLWVGPLALLVGVHAFRTLAGARRRRALVASAVAFALAASQIAHGFVALRFTHERHSIYGGVSNRVGAFLDEVGRQILLGPAHEDWRLSGYLLAAVVVLPILGFARLDRRLRLAVVVAFATPFLAAFGLSFASEVEARYLCFALPGLAALTGLGLASLPLALGAGAGLALLGTMLSATARAFGPPATDWYAAAGRLEQLKQPDDVVAVFPGYWADTFRFYTRVSELAPVTYPVDLERVLARGRRVLLVVNGGRYRGDLDAYLAAYTARRVLFTTTVRDTFDVDTVKATAPLARAPAHSSSAVMFTGLLGSGGYAWTDEPSGARAFDRLRELFGAADLAVTEYAAYEPSWPARVLLGDGAAKRLRPDRRVAEALRRAGVGVVAVSGEYGRADAARSVLESAHLATVPSLEGGAAREPTFYAAGGERVALVSLGTEVPSSARAVALVASFRARLRATDALVVFVAAPGSFTALPTAPERELGHRLVDAGADVVIGNGSCVAQPVERYGTGVVAYSLGTLLAPSSFDLMAREATGSALRVGFAGGRPTEVDVLPVTFDDRARPRLGRSDAVVTDVSAEFAPFVATLPKARATSSSPGEDARSIAYLPAPAPAAWELWFERDVKRWVPWSSRGTSPRPFTASFDAERSFAGLRGARSLGVPRAVLELDAAPGTSLALEFPPLVLGHRLTVFYGLADDREQSKYRPWLDETLTLSVENGPALSRSLPFQSGWHGAVLDTTALSGAERSVVLRVSSPASHFPVACELRIEP